MENMPGMGDMVPPHHESNSTDHTMTMMHMTFFWGKNAHILFAGWPGKRTGMYVLALIFIFLLSVIVEWLTHSRWISDRESCGNNSRGVIRTIVHGLRIGLGYLVMLAVMSFNAGVFIVAVGGHTLGFFLFGSRLIFNKSAAKDFPPPTSCS
ncbi:hypothetical protein BUALT_Bualt13G0087900 [Buddleja alternifolia]|uniref:Copper transport protein n=1 Tax=Buddleja alternifolia TaxID=168488 RepID=A0AAV6WK13_9LAMI|nr:hypothetical protein BUALT_Bualt13G0087900 [Buddleja alternifolia]